MGRPPKNVKNGAFYHIGESVLDLTFISMMWDVYSKWMQSCPLPSTADNSVPISPAWGWVMVPRNGRLSGRPPPLKVLLRRRRCARTQLDMDLIHPWIALDSVAWAH